MSAEPNPSLGVASARISSTAGDAAKRRRVSEAKKAESRLRRIEQISKYREEKIKREFMKLEGDLRAEDQRKQEENRKEKIRQQWLESQRGRLAEYAQAKALKEHQKRAGEAKARQDDVTARAKALQRNELQKQKIQMYKEMKAQQILELQMRE